VPENLKSVKKTAKYKVFSQFRKNLHFSGIVRYLKYDTKSGIPGTAGKMEGKTAG